jgi:L-malate glycosyltransferase
MSRVAVCCAITPPDYGGAGLSAFKLAERLERQGRLAFVVTRTREGGNGRRMFDDSDGLPVVSEGRVIRVSPRHARRDGGPGKLSDMLPFAWASLALAGSTAWQLLRRAKDYDVLHCFTPSWLSLYVMMMGKLLGKQAILEVTLIGRDEPQALPYRDVLGIKRAAKNLQYRLADRIVAISPALKLRFVEAGYTKKVEVITRSVDVQRFHPVDQEERRRLRSELGLATDGPILLFVGEIGLRKGADLLIPILARVAKVHPTAELVIVGQVGEAEHKKVLYQRMLNDIKHHNLENQVHFVPRTGAIERYMKAATLFIFPSRREGFGTVVIEAMACGAVPVTLRIRGITDHMIDQGKSGLYVEEDQTNHFVSAIMSVLQDRESLARISAAGVHAVRERFSTDAVDSAYRTLYGALQRRTMRSG